MLLSQFSGVACFCGGNDKGEGKKKTWQHALPLNKTLKILTHHRTSTSCGSKEHNELSEGEIF